MFDVELTETDELLLFMVNSSNDYLTEPLPANFAELDEGVLNTFIQEHLWQPMEDFYDEPQQVYDFIENSAFSAMRFARKMYKRQAGEEL